MNYSPTLMPSSREYQSSNDYQNFSSTANTTSNAPRRPLPATAPIDRDLSLPPVVSSRTYHQNQTGSKQWDLPPGWKVAYRESDGRMYYWELSSGKTSWAHPYASMNGSSDRNPSFLPLNFGGLVSSADRADIDARSKIMESPATASKRPDSHQCCALFSCILFPPLGIFALVHSCLTYRTWSQGRYGDAHDHSKQAYDFATWGIIVFVLIVVIRTFFPQFNLDIFRIWD